MVFKKKSMVLTIVALIVQKLDKTIIMVKILTIIIPIILFLVTTNIIFLVYIIYDFRYLGVLRKTICQRFWKRYRYIVSNYKYL